MNPIEKENSQLKKRKVIIVPHTHWDREWYEPFQHFRYKLAKLIDELLEIMPRIEYYFMLDGQTVVLEDYFEIRENNKEDLLKIIRDGRIGVGPWYLLPDEWLVGGESLIRNLEFGADLSKKWDIPLMKVAYLPDQFGHSRAIPQIISDLTSFKAAVIWRGVGPEIKSVPFWWRSHENSTTEILCIYLPRGYGNAASLPEELDPLSEQIKERIEDLEPFSPLPLFLLMNGSDHLFPQPKIKELLPKIKIENTNLSIGLLEHFVDAMTNEIEKSGIELQRYSGEFRSSARAPLLQDTYSARMWIKLWNQKVEDMLVCKVEPMCLHANFHLGIDYPYSFLATAWKWLLRNQPHDSICGCSIDQTHEEMRTRFSWAESIAEAIYNDFETTIKERFKTTEDSCIIAYNPTNCSQIPVYIELEIPDTFKVNYLNLSDGNKYPIQLLKSSMEILLERTFSALALKTLFKLAPGRKVANYYINDIQYFDGDQPGLCEVRIIVDTIPIGEFDVEEVKKEAWKVITSGKYKKFHGIAMRQSKSVFGAVLPLRPWTFTKIELLEEINGNITGNNFMVSKNGISTRFYDIMFKKDGSISLVDKKTGVIFERLNYFEDWGDRGDEYTFGRLGPEKSRVLKFKWRVVGKGPVFIEIEQSGLLEIFERASDDLTKRVGKAKIPFNSSIRFYNSIPRIDINLKIKNKAKDHRLRVCFDLPFKTDHCYTATHFGTIKRQGEPFKYENYSEMPSGIQAQKRYIRVIDEKSNVSLTIMNAGMPEVELVDKSRVAMTLIRCVGALSRDDFPERSMHAGPPMDTPGAQELDAEYEFNYAIMVHEASDPMHVCDDYADTFAVKPAAMFIQQAEPMKEIFEPVFEIDDPWIRVSSARMKDGQVLLTIFNLSNESKSVVLGLHKNIKKCARVRIGGEIVKEYKIANHSVKLSFDPYEIKMLALEK
ncbi:MAG: glycoside hydrolase family 38 C-terminal domain-containing protein [Promethearchaeota archaeon]